jgi:guanine nucleotide-binding protein subunit alpha
MRRRLTPLLATDSQLAHRLSGGVTISGGKSGVLVRSGWQARATEKVGKHFHKSASETDFRRGREPDFEDDGEILLEEVGRMLSLLKEDIRELWGHPTVKGLIMKRKLKLDEWSELLVLFVPPVRSP